jgi:D-hydroxyproline dehydrogenase subunit gamma
MTNANATRLQLTIDGRSVAVEAGTTVAAALVMAGAGGTRTSVSGQARAALCGMGVCQECRATIDGRAHALACQTRCREGQVVCTTVATATANVANVANAANVASAASASNVASAASASNASNAANAANASNGTNGTTTTGTR